MICDQISRALTITAPLVWVPFPLPRSPGSRSRTCQPTGPGDAYQLGLWLVGMAGGADDQVTYRWREAESV